MSLVVALQVLFEMADQRDFVWKYGIEIGTGIKGYEYIQCVFCKKILAGRAKRLKEHILGVRGNVASCSMVTQEAKDEIRMFLASAENAKNQPQKVQEERADQSQRGRGEKMSDDSVVDVEFDGAGDPWRSIGIFFFECGIPFEAADLPSFTGFLQSLSPDFDPPTSHDLETTILKEEMGYTKAFVDKIEKTWPLTGVSILVDGWKDDTGREFVNFLVSNPHGTVFLKSVDVSAAVKDSKMMFKVLDGVVEVVGEDVTVQVVTDNTPNYKEAGEMSMEKRKRLWWTPCVANCIDSILEQIAELPQHKMVLSKVKKVKYL